MSRVRQPGRTIGQDPVAVREFNRRRKSGLRAVRVERDWTDAQEKVQREGRCRICNSPKVEAAHIIGRACDRQRRPDVEERLAQLEILLADGEIHAAVELASTPPASNPEVLYVHPDAIAVLCRDCHSAYDGAPGTARIDILSVLTLEEQLRAVEDAGGVELVRMRTAPSLYQEQP